jgi:CrcB protein
LFESGAVPSEYRFLILTGFLGSFTTFSTFSYQSLELLKNGFPASFLINVIANVLLCLLGAWVGLVLGGTIRIT